MGYKVGNATVPIVADAQEWRRCSTKYVKVGEVCDQDEHLKIRAGYCTPVTGSDHPFAEEQVDRTPENVRAFVGEIVYKPCT
jgi:hypothetical protein